MREWITTVGASTAFIEPGSPWENDYCESFNSKLRDELLNGEIFYSLAEARIVIEGWRQHYNTKRPHSSLDYRPPAPAAVPWPQAPRRPASPATSTVADKPTMHWIRTGPPNGGRPVQLAQRRHRPHRTAANPHPHHRGRRP